MTRARERREMKRELTLALGRGELSVVYQPQIDIASKLLTGFGGVAALGQVRRTGRCR